MICREWQKMIPEFLDGTLKNRELEGFVNHVRTCKDCYEELEIMFMLSIGLQELKEDRSISYNFSLLLENKIRDVESYCEQIRKVHRIYVFVMLVLHLFLIVGIGLEVLRFL